MQSKEELREQIDETLNELKTSNLKDDELATGITVTFAALTSGILIDIRDTLVDLNTTLNTIKEELT